MCDIEKPLKPFGQEIVSVSTLLQNITDWHTTYPPDRPDADRAVWYRGHGDDGYLLQPGVYRSDFTGAARRLASAWHWGLERSRLYREREMLSEFQTSGATLIGTGNFVDIYFMAQHFGMPTRLLDWTTNPLAALYFAVCDGKSEDGDVFMMDADQLKRTPDPAEPKKYPRGIVTMRHPYVIDAISESFWIESKRDPLIIPVRPDNKPGRIAQQSSCFTLHMHRSRKTNINTLVRMRVVGNKKNTILNELRRLNINEFSIYNDLDHLSREIRQTGGLPSRPPLY